MARKKIVGLEVVAAGSNPDIDTDFNTKLKDDMFHYVSDVYGHDNVASIVTFSSLGAKSAIQTLGTIYQIPPSAVLKVTALVPPPVEGVEMSLKDIYDETSERYIEAQSFREAVSSEKWQKVIKSAARLDGRYKGTGVHACGVIISSHPLSDAIPVMIREKDNRTITQWTYPDCESLGLIKYDFLGLDTVDILMRGVEYIWKNRGEHFSVLDLIHGPMDDAETYKTFARGDTMGIFQFRSEMVRQFLRFMMPNEFRDLVATTAILRPGPMGMKSHERYAKRKNGMEKVSALHKDFIKSPLEEILDETYGLIVYQESVMKISNQIGNFTLKEADALRKAMGKKKPAVMAAMKSKFIEGGLSNGYSQEGLEQLWDTMAEFGRYGFNKSHSVAYAMTAYAAGYMKTHYPAEFMAALIAQAIGDKDKVIASIQEATRMGLTIRTVDINESEVFVAPQYSDPEHKTILYGLSGISSVSETMSEIIVQERNENGPYTSIQDVVSRCVPLGVNNKTIYENLAKAGAFDSFGYTRRAVTESIPVLMEEAKTVSKKGENLFDMLMEEDDDMAQIVELEGIEEWHFEQYIQYESDAIGLYLTEHPLGRAGIGISPENTPVTSIQKLVQRREFSRTNEPVVVIGSITEMITKKAAGGHKNIQITIDDGTGYLSAKLSKDFLAGIARFEAQKAVEKAYVTGERSILPEIVEKACNGFVTPVEPLSKGGIYKFSIVHTPDRNGDGPGWSRVESAERIFLSHDGKLPLRIRPTLQANETPQSLKERVQQWMKNAVTNYAGEYPVQFAFMTPKNSTIIEDLGPYYEHLAEGLKTVEPTFVPAKKRQKKKKAVTNSGLFGDDGPKEETKGEWVRELPKPEEVKGIQLVRRPMTEKEKSLHAEYKTLEFRLDKSNGLKSSFESEFPAAWIDFGIFGRAIEDIYDE